MVLDVLLFMTHKKDFNYFQEKNLVADYLNGEFTEKVLFINNGIIKLLNRMLVNLKTDLYLTVK